MSCAKRQEFGEATDSGGQLGHLGAGGGEPCQEIVMFGLCPPGGCIQQRGLAVVHQGWTHAPAGQAHRRPLPHAGRPHCDRRRTARRPYSRADQPGDRQAPLHQSTGSFAPDTGFTAAANTTVATAVACTARAWRTPFAPRSGSGGSQGSSDAVRPGAGRSAASAPCQWRGATCAARMDR